MQVIITKDQLEKAHACSVYSKSIEWDESRQALVYSDWGKTVERLLATRAGTAYLDFLVVRGLVPMTKEALTEARAKSRNREVGLKP